MTILIILNLETKSKQIVQIEGNALNTVTKGAIEVPNT